MKNKKITIMMILFMILMCVGCRVLATEASEQMPIQEETSQEENTEKPEDWYDSDLFLVEGDTLVNKIVDGNAFIIGDTVEITGEIGGDLFVIAKKLVIDEEAVIYSNLFALAEKIEVNGACYDLYSSSQECIIGESAYINRDARIIAEKVIVNGVIKRNAFIGSDSIQFKENATCIYGKLDYSTERELDIPENVVKGEVKFVKIEETEERGFLYYFSELIATLFFAFVITMLVMWLAPNFEKKLVKGDIRKSFIALGIGVLAVIATIILFILLLCTSIGINVAFTLLGTFILMCAISFPIAFIHIAGQIAEKIKWQGKVKLEILVLCITVIVWTIKFIPIVGGLLQAIIYLLGIGTLILNILPINKQTIERNT